jgi:hypothetical protein
MRVQHAVPLRKLTKPGAVRESPLLVTLEAFSRERLERLGMITSLLHEHVDVRGSLSTTCT